MQYTQSELQLQSFTFSQSLLQELLSWEIQTVHADSDIEYDWLLDEEDLPPEVPDLELPPAAEIGGNSDVEEEEEDGAGAAVDEGGDGEGGPGDNAAGPLEPLNDVLHARMVHLIESYSLASEERQLPDEDASTIGWAQAAGKRLSWRDEESQLVADYAYDHLKLYRENVQSRKCADAHLHMNASRQFPARGEPDPAGFSNCYPPSIAACEAILQVPDLSTYMIHLCPNGCEHWWTFMQDFKRHYKDCGGCHLCRCPHCDAHRFVYDKKGLRGRQVCWLFFDVFQTMMLDPELAQVVLEGQAARNDASVPDTNRSKPSLAKYKEGKRLLEVLPAHGYDMAQV